MRKMVMIGTIVDRNLNIVGYRILSVDTGTRGRAKYKDVSTDTVIKSLRQGAYIENLKLAKGYGVEPTNGKFERYTQIMVGTNEYVGDTAPAVILYSIENGYNYILVNYIGDVIRCTFEDTLKILNQKGIANAKLVQRGQSRFISSIQGNYDNLKIVKERRRKNGK